MCLYVCVSMCVRACVWLWVGVSVNVCGCDRQGLLLLLGAGVLACPKTSTQRCTPSFALARRSQLAAASAAIKVFQAHQKMEALQKEEVSRCSREGYAAVDADQHTSTQQQQHIQAHKGSAFSLSSPFSLRRMNTRQLLLTAVLHIRSPYQTHTSTQAPCVYSSLSSVCTQEERKAVHQITLSHTTTHSVSFSFQEERKAAAAAAEVAAAANSGAASGATRSPAGPGTLNGTFF